MPFYYITQCTSVFKAYEFNQHYQISKQTTKIKTIEITKTKSSNLRIRIPKLVMVLSGKGFPMLRSVHNLYDLAL